jgi:hypothetical protein
VDFANPETWIGKRVNIWYQVRLLLCLIHFFFFYFRHLTPPPT